MGFFRRLGFLLIINIFVITMASILATVISTAFGLEGEWTFYIVFYSLIGFWWCFSLSLYIKMDGKKIYEGEDY